MSTAEALNCAAAAAAIAKACATIAPTWPLDRFIAVNPFWGCIDRTFETTAAELSRLSSARLWMPREFYRQAWERGEITSAHLAQAARELESSESLEGLVQALQRPADSVATTTLLSDLLDSGRDLLHEPAWRDTITHQVSQYCAAYFDDAQADWRPDRAHGLYAGWRRGMEHDHSVALLMNARQISKRARLLPATAHQMIERALSDLHVDSRHAPELLRAVLLRINGWASWCAYLRWQARLQNRDDEHIVELLAIRLAWEWLLGHGRTELIQRWGAALSAAFAQPMISVDADAVWQRALEIAYQTPLAAALAASRTDESTPAPEVQAVFCIDVRSEVFRRALERAAPEVQTLGFAGFFGLPISYTPLGTQATRPQLPGLLASALETTETLGDAGADAALAERRGRRLALRDAWRSFDVLPGSAFSRVEALGIGYLPKLIASSTPRASRRDSPDVEGVSATELVRLRTRLKTAEAGAQAQVALAERVLRAMSLVGEFARIVLLTGHGSQSANNPHAAGLDCGACCGQTGEVNARALAGLLNNRSVRAALASRGIVIGDQTHFLAALHNTTTDEVELFEIDLVPPSHTEDLTRLRERLDRAGDFARAERAASLGVSQSAKDGEPLLRAFKERASDWAQTRPEWGLANNAAFIVAPRSRTRGLNLQGRAFLHDYVQAQDPDRSVLELIMTAPMVVTHWINMQYYASTVDNRRYGSGNKVLHNVVGGHIGVFEGNGGDLRIGLPLQSLHDGARWMHAPQRLSVFIESDRTSIEAITSKHEVVRQLIQNRWLYLFRMDPDGEGVEAYDGSGWRAPA